MKKLTKKYASVTAMKADGWTDQELTALVNGPRSKAAEWDEEHTYFRWPYIDGISIVGLFSLLTREEKDAYNAYHKKHGPNGSRTGVMSTANKEILEKCNALEAFIKENVPEEAKAKALELLAAIRPVVKNNDMQLLFGVDDISQLHTKVTRTWIMYRGPNGERGENPAEFTLAKALAAWGEDMQCVITKAAIDEKVNKLKAKGIDVTNVIL